ncbi:DUF4396 domain-containing protein [Aspergillus mulundensis]|uniref:DUF4396 domain-containing protein n=1 Tax=Aspergillus mulundensis TaxID=1810919 RepID=A0A3D8RSS8_9EURO|nr:Uncharacterized protein DSM5745_06863 [Aspergillus mulundensis]RDW76871.1 Uncharacterized protein DSM5745_06863 [Aspergillus mulundensis]
MLCSSRITNVCRQRPQLLSSCLSGDSRVAIVPSTFSADPDRLSYAKRTASTCNRHSQTPKSKPSPLSPATHRFWTCRSTWRRAGINTLRCLLGCTVGDFSALWTLQTYFPELGMGAIMGVSMASGITTSIILETVLLHRGDRLPWMMAMRTAMGMSFVSMLAMEAAENLVDYHLTGGVIALDDVRFWMAAVVSVGAGFLAPLPYNYWRLRKFGRACH